jgi:chloramphenicol 3-O phosphotransferase
MRSDDRNGTIIILNGAPRSGKSSIARIIQEEFTGVWINLGVDAFMQMTPKRYQPGIGLRPGGERPDLEPLLPLLYAALYESIAAHAKLGLNVVADVGHHDGHSKPLGIFNDCAARLLGLKVIMVGIRCDLATIMQRRQAADPQRPNLYLRGTPDVPVPAPVALWQTAVHQPGLYDLEVDTSMLDAALCAAAIRRYMDDDRKNPTACERLAAASAHPATT